MSVIPLEHAGARGTEKMPGKYEGNSDEGLAERLYRVTLDGFQVRDFGSVQDVGYYAVVTDPRSWMVGTQDSNAYVIREDSQGFVDILEGPVSIEDAETWLTMIEDEMGEDLTD